MVQGPPPTYAAPQRPGRAGSVLIGLVVVLVVAAAGAAGTLVAARGAVDEVQRVPDVSSVLSPSTGSVENYLLVGSDSRANADPNAPDAGGIGTEADVQGNRSDTIMVLRVDTAAGTGSLLSIPRDLWVDIPGRKNPSRINSAYNDGPVTLVQTVQTALGIPVQHYAEVDFNGFKSLVDAIGGVELCFLYPTRDTNTGLNVPQPGCFLFDGVQALAYARSRHFEQFKEDGQWHEDPTSDLGRTQRQRDFVDRALAAGLAEVKRNPFRAGALIESSTGAVRVDDDLDVFSAAADLRPAVSSGIGSYALPVRGETIDGNAVLLLGDGADQVLAFFRGDGPPPPAAG